MPLRLWVFDLSVMEESNEFVVCQDAHESVGSSVGDINFSCRFSFLFRKNVSKECRMEYLKLLYESMTERVDNACSDV